ncbi:MAG: carbon-nitrogen family hydrolase [Roseburia sp.]|nr:carbon-nitrogen family hydrolase [Roseburia sp.]
MGTMKIALTSMDIRYEDKSVNRKKCVELIKRASDFGARLILFPEMTLTGFTMEVGQCGETAEEHGLPETVSYFAEKSSEYGMAVGFGYIENRRGMGRNHFVVVDNGRIIGDYEKMHPFTYGEEAHFYEAGDKLASVEIDGVKFGLFVCYDLRFPEIFQKSSEENDVLAVIANWPKDRVAHWHCLLQARAVETQSVMLGVNRKGSGGGLEYEASSEAFDCLGHRLEGTQITTSFKDECILYEIDPELSQKVRNGFPVKKDRRKEIYRTFYEV